MKIKSQIGAMEIILPEESQSLNTPEINLEFEGTMSEVLELYKLQKQVMKESPELILGFFKECFAGGVDLGKYMTKAVESVKTTENSYRDLTDHELPEQE